MRFDEKEDILAENAEAFADGERVVVAVEGAQGNSCCIYLSQRQAINLCKEFLQLFCDPAAVAHVASAALWDMHWIGRDATQECAESNSKCTPSSEPLFEEEHLFD